MNHSPSFHTDHKLDKEIKEALLMDTLNLVNFGAVDKRKCMEEEKRRIKERLFQRQNKRETKCAWFYYLTGLCWSIIERVIAWREELDKAQAKWLLEQDKYEETHLGNFRRVFPTESNGEKYEKFFHSSGSLYQETAAFKARSECAR